MPKVTPSPQPRVILVYPPLTTSPGTPLPKRTTIAQTPLPNRIRTSVPRNSAITSAGRPSLRIGSEFYHPVMAQRHEVVMRPSFECPERACRARLPTGGPLSIMEAEVHDDPRRRQQPGSCAG